MAGRSVKGMLSFLGSLFCLIFAILLIWQVWLGWYMTGLELYDRWYHFAPMLHKSNGIILLVMAIAGFVTGIIAGPPSLRGFLRSMRYNPYGSRHLLLYGLVIVIISLGYTVSTSAGAPIPFFDLVDLPPLFKAGKGIGKAADRAHMFLAYTAVFIILIHSLRMSGMKGRWGRRKKNSEYKGDESSLSP